MGTNAGWLAAGAAGATVFVAMLALVASGSSAGIDRDISGAFGVALAIDASRLLAIGGTTLAVGILAFLAACFLAWKRRWWDFVRVVVIPPCFVVASFAVKEMVERARPPYALDGHSGYSFPSGHATSGAGLAILLAYFALTTRGSKRWVVLLLLAASAAWALAQALGRLVLGVHYVSDVVAGLGLGVAVASFALLGIAAAERFVKKS